MATADGVVTPVRAPDVVRGDVPGLLCRGMPMLWPALLFVHDDHRRYILQDPTDPAHRLSDVDWSDRAAIYLSLAWLADRGHVCTWMLPTTHGGRVEAWDGLTAWEVSAILVARSVGRVARGLGPVGDMMGEWARGERRPVRRIANGNPLCEVSHYVHGWLYVTIANHGIRGNETGDAGKLAADRAALADGCVLQVPGGLLFPDLGADK